MNKIISGLFVVALMGASLVIADEGRSTASQKDMKKIVEEGPYLETSQKGIVLSGYVDAGYQYNFNGRGENMGTSPRFDNSFFFFEPTAGDSKNRGDFDLNAVKLALEKPLTNANELQAGFRVDAMIGEDASLLGQNAGGSDSVFLEQAYVQFRLPYGNGIDFKVGKFVSPLGYEVIERPVNMNITYGNIFINEIPRWHTGFLASYKIDDTFDVKFGIVNGSNTDNGIGVDADDDAALLAALNIAPASNLNWYNAMMYGINGGNIMIHPLPGFGPMPVDDAPVVIYDTYINWKPKFAKDKLLLGFNANIGSAVGQTTPTGLIPDNTSWWGAATYAKYKFNDFFSLANRFDYIHNDNGTKFGNGNVITPPFNYIPSRIDLWSETITAQFDVIQNMMLRLEYRADFGKDLMSTSVGIPPLDLVTVDGPLHTAVAEVVYSF